MAAVFGEDDDDEEEEMPLEARQRMRNVGRLVFGFASRSTPKHLLLIIILPPKKTPSDTPTSAGPNSFHKTARGFESRRLAEKVAAEGDGGQASTAGAKPKIQPSGIAFNIRRK